MKGVSKVSDYKKPILQNVGLWFELVWILLMLIDRDLVLFDRTAVYTVSRRLYPAHPGQAMSATNLLS